MILISGVEGSENGTACDPVKSNGMTPLLLLELGLPLVSIDARPARGYAVDSGASPPITRCRSSSAACASRKRNFCWRACDAVVRCSTEPPGQDPPRSRSSQIAKLPHVAKTPIRGALLAPSSAIRALVPPYK